MTAGLASVREARTQALPDPEHFRARARIWLGERLERRPRDEGDRLPWGVGDHDVSVFHSLSFEDERALIERANRWQQDKCDAGFGAITWPTQYGGGDLPVRYEELFLEEEAAFATRCPTRRPR